MYTYLFADPKRGKEAIDSSKSIVPAYKGRKPKKTKSRNLYGRLVEHESAVLAFAKHEEVPFTNNQGERDLRPVKRKLKIAGCFRTFTGLEIYARLQSFISTTRKHQRNVFDELVATFEGKNFLTYQGA